MSEFDQLGQAARWLARTGWRVTRGLPGGERAERRLLDLETTVVNGLRRRLEPDGVVTLVRPMHGQGQPLRAGMADLLNRSAHAHATHTPDSLLRTILRHP